MTLEEKLLNETPTRNSLPVDEIEMNEHPDDSFRSIITAMPLHVRRPVERVKYVESANELVICSVGMDESDGVTETE